MGRGGAGAAATSPGVDLTDPAAFAAGFPHDAFARLRAEAPVWFHPPGAGMADGFWVLSRHADCRAAATDARLHAAHRAGRAALDGMAADRYVGLRNLLGPGVSPAAMRGIEDEVRRTADHLVSGFVRRGGGDLVGEVAALLAFQTTARVLGVPDRDRGSLFELVAAAIAEDDDGDAAQAAVHSYGRKLIGQKHKHPGADLLSKAIHAHLKDTDPDHDHLDQAEVLRLFDVLVTAGIDTTRDAIAVGVLALAEHPDEWAVLQHDRSQLRHATEEILRWASPTPCDWRYALGELELGGERIAAGDRVTLWWASANRDGAAFAAADTFDVRRDPNPHLGFGHGPHACFGATIARLQVRLLIDVLLERAKRVRLASEPQWRCGSEHTSLGRLDVTFDQ